MGILSIDWAGFNQTSADVMSADLTGLRIERFEIGRSSVTAMGYGAPDKIKKYKNRTYVYASFPVCHKTDIQWF